MANILTKNFTHTYAGQEFLSRLYYQPQHTEGINPYSEFQIFPNVKTKTNIYLPQRLQGIIREDTGCGFSAVGTTNINDKTISVSKLKINTEMCESEFDNTVWAELRRSGVDRNDLRGTDIENVMNTVTARAMAEDLKKQMWFSDSASSDAFYGIYDGYIRLKLDNSSSLGYAKDMANITGALNGTAIHGTDGAMKVLRDMYEGQSVYLRAIPARDKRFYVTSTVFDSLLKTYQNTGTDSGLAKLATGADTLSFNGIPVIDMVEWTLPLADETNPVTTTIDAGHLVVLSFPDNFAVATDVTNPESEIVSWYDMKDEKVYTKGKWMHGVQCIHDEYIGIAFA